MVVSTRPRRWVRMARLLTWAHTPGSPRVSWTCPRVASGSRGIARLTPAGGMGVGGLDYHSNY